MASTGGRPCRRRTRWTGSTPAPTSGATEDALIFSNADTIIGLTDFDSTGAALPAGTTTYKTPCGKEIKAEPVSARTVDDTVEVTMIFRATCPDGQLVDGTNTELALTSTSGSNEVLARTTFDFSRSPVWVGEDDERRVVVRYPVGTVWAPVDDIEKGIADKTVIIGCEHSTSKSGKDRPDDDAKNESGQPTFQGYGPNEQTRNEANDNALAALRRQAALDANEVAGLEGRWVPQLSSKLNGTFDAVDNHTYDYSDIWNEHLRLRLRYPDALLLNSTDWKSYRNPGFWVTVVGPTRDDWKPVLTWCTDEGFPDSHCGAKRLLRAGPLEGSYHTRSE